MEFTSLERAVLDWIAERTGNAALSRQIASARPVSRELTGFGSFTTLEVADPAALPLRGASPIEPAVQTPQVADGLGTVLHVRGGFVSMLELYTNAGEPLPDGVTEWVLYRRRR